MGSLAWVRELVSTPQPEHPRFKAGLSVLSVLGPDDAAALLRQRLAALEQAAAATRALLAEHPDVPRLFLVEDEYELALREAEAAWVRALVVELETGSFPDIAAWRTAYATLIGGEHAAP